MIGVQNSAFYIELSKIYMKLIKNIKQYFRNLFKSCIIFFKIVNFCKAFIFVCSNYIDDSLLIKYVLIK